MSANPVFIARKSATADDGLSPEAIMVRDTLIRHGLETPMLETGLTPEQKYEHIKDLMAEVVDDGTRYLKDEDHKAMARYLKSLPAIENREFQQKTGKKKTARDEW